MNAKKLVVLQIVQISSIAPDKLEEYCLTRAHIQGKEVLDHMWTPVVHVQYEPSFLEGLQIEAVDMKTMACWTDEGESMYDSEQRTAIGASGKWYIIVNDEGDYEWL